MSEFVTATLGDFASVISGYAFKSGEFGDEGIPVIKIANIRMGYVDLEGCARVSTDYLSSLKEKYQVNGSDVLISLTGSHLTQPNSVVGRVAHMPASAPLSMLNQRAGKVIINDIERCDTGYLYYYLSVASMRGDIAVMASGAASQANVSPSQVESLQVSLPPLPTQRRIASILSTYDDLIENNTRRIAILAEMARRLYEEWFVKFRFPGHEEVSFDGELPYGWESLALGDVTAVIKRGISPKYDDDSRCRVINQKCIRDQRLTMDLSRRQSKKVPEDKYVQFGDVLINSTGVGTLGRVAQVYEQFEDVTVDSHVTIVRPDETTDVDFFGYALFYLQAHFEDQGVGATGQTELSRTRVAETEVVRPPTGLQERFGEAVEPLRSMCVALLKKNSNLRTQRDLLLPKLVSGQIDVSEIELPDTEEAAA